MASDADRERDIECLPERIPAWVREIAWRKIFSPLPIPDRELGQYERFNAAWRAQ